MKTRIITSVVAVCVLLPVLYFSNTVVICVALAAVTVISLAEMLKCIGANKLYISAPLYALGVACPFLVRYMENLYHFATIAFICGALYLMYLFTLAITSHGKIKFSDAATIFTVSLYIIAALNAILYIRDFGENGKYIYLLIFLGAWITDIFAYFTGVFFGKHKLIPDVSPKKTVEGSIGGTVFCSISFVVLGIVTDAFFGTDANLIFLAIGGVIAAVIAQIGDLIMSVIKRHYGIKDYGKLFPGHGGMLDRFDSILAVSLGIVMMCMFASITGINIL
ncbi:MAG: phosphatidate cytidylyltransferase [Clostridia bacterium]|nr:phosphatidate cytidylyltransferase [Clostridia bacterium]